MEDKFYQNELETKESKCLYQTKQNLKTFRENNFYKLSYELKEIYGKIRLKTQEENWIWKQIKTRRRKITIDGEELQNTGEKLLFSTRDKSDGKGHNTDK